MSDQIATQILAELQKQTSILDQLFRAVTGQQYSDHGDKLESLIRINSGMSQKLDGIESLLNSIEVNTSQ